LNNVLRLPWDQFGKFVMVNDRAIAYAKMREQWAKLKSAAIADLERRGYDVRGFSRNCNSPDGLEAIEFGFPGRCLIICRIWAGVLPRTS
jgi:hypothetical protein